MICQRMQSPGLWDVFWTARRDPKGGVQIPITLAISLCPQIVGPCTSAWWFVKRLSCRHFKRWRRDCLLTRRSFTFYMTVVWPNKVESETIFVSVNGYGPAECLVTTVSNTLVILSHGFTIHCVNIESFTPSWVFTELSNEKCSVCGTDSSNIFSTCNG